MVLHFKVIMASISIDFPAISLQPSILIGVSHTLFSFLNLFFFDYFHPFCPYGKDHSNFIFACVELGPVLCLLHLSLAVVILEHSY